jgi:putative peptide zinc metalloprotease protein
MTATPAAPTRTGTSPTEVPVRASGVELVGELPGSGYKEPPALVRRSDGQTIQLTRLLYTVLEEVDGRRAYPELADAVSRSFGRQVTAEQVAALVDGKLRPLGLLRRADGSEPVVRKANPLLAVRFKYVVSDPRITRRVTAPFAALFHPLVVVPLALSFVVVSTWVLFHEGLAAATRDAFTQPGLFLLVFAITVLSAGFHEFGHAAACRYGGATPGAMGAGLYLVWPAFYTEVSDSYRLGRAGRVRVDLGGLYFNAVFAVAMFGVWAVTRWEAWLLVIGAQVLQMLRQLAPFVRFDGYHILADLTGVPDLYSHIKPTIVGLLPHRWRTPSALTWWARAVVSVWVLVVVPLLLLSLVMMVVALPRAIGTAWASLGAQAHSLHLAWLAGDLPQVGVRLLSILAIALPVLGMLYLLGRLLRRVVRSTLRATEGRPGRRAVAGLTAVALLGALAWAWWPDGERYRPIAPGERGTVVDAVPASLASRVPLLRQVAAPQPPEPTLHEGDKGSAQSLWASKEQPPAKDQPRLALVLVPSDTAPQAAQDALAAGGSAAPEAPTWVFPFDPPEAPGVGDNQALAVNTTDGSTVYDVAFALVWADDGSATNTNEAYAFASCAQCTTVAVAFQVVLVLGQADVVVPQNLSAAVNYNCLQCVTYSLAQQLVLTLDGPLSDAGMTAVQDVWTQVQQFAQTIQGQPLDQIQSTLAGYEQQLVDIVEAESRGETPTPSPSSTTTSATGTPVPSGMPTGTATSGVTGSSGSPSPTSSAPSTAATASGTPTSSPTSSDGRTGSPEPTTTPTATGTGSATAAP